MFDGWNLLVKFFCKSRSASRSATHDQYEFGRICSAMYIALLISIWRRFWVDARESNKTMKKQIKTIHMLFAAISLFAASFSHGGSASESNGTVYVTVPSNIMNPVTGYVEVDADTYYYGWGSASILPLNDGEGVSVYTDSYTAPGYQYESFIGGPGPYKLEASSSGSGSAYTYITW